MEINDATSTCRCTKYELNARLFLGPKGQPDVFGRNAFGDRNIPRKQANTSLQVVSI